MPLNLPFNFGIQELCNFYGRHKELANQSHNKWQQFRWLKWQSGKSGIAATPPASFFPSTLNSNPISLQKSSSYLFEHFTFCICSPYFSYLLRRARHK